MAVGGPGGTMERAPVTDGVESWPLLLQPGPVRRQPPAQAGVNGRLSRSSAPGVPALVRDAAPVLRAISDVRFPMSDIRDRQEL